jgi:hypothetical protein
VKKYNFKNKIEVNKEYGKDIIALKFFVMVVLVFSKLIINN